MIGADIFMVCVGVAVVAVLVAQAYVQYSVEKALSDKENN